jgi:hypothetical protein
MLSLFQLKIRKLIGVTPCVVQPPFKNSESSRAKAGLISQTDVEFNRLNYLFFPSHLPKKYPVLT